MINVNDLYLKIEDTAVKDQHGNFNNDEFNRMLVNAQNDVMNFFLSKDGESSFVHDALAPFIKTYSTFITYPVSLPADYRSKRSARVQIPRMIDGVATFNWEPLHFLKTDEEYETLKSPIRGPSIQNEVYVYSIDADGINIKPTNLPGTFEMKYVRHPLVAIRAVTVDPVNEIETYNAGGSVQLEWPSQLFNMFHEVICFYLGINIRDSEIIQWLAAKQVKI